MSRAWPADDVVLSQRCCLMSPTCVQVMYTSKSKINSCTGDPEWPLDAYRYERPMGPMTAGRLTRDIWRKSHQWCARPGRVTQGLGSRD